VQLGDRGTNKKDDGVGLCPTLWLMMMMMMTFNQEALSSIRHSDPYVLKKTMLRSSVN
jgi:hypothetical protein